MDLGKKVKIMIDEGIQKYEKEYSGNIIMLTEEIKRLQNLCKKNNIAYKIAAKKK